MCVCMCEYVLRAKMVRSGSVCVRARVYRCVVIVVCCVELLDRDKGIHLKVMRIGAKCGLWWPFSLRVRQETIAATIAQTIGGKSAETEACCERQQHEKLLCCVVCDVFFCVSCVFHLA